MIKKLIRNLYWKYGHEGDPWQARLVVHYLGKVIRTEVAPSHWASGRYLISQIEEKLNEPLTMKGLMLGNPVKLTGIADIFIGDFNKEELG